MKLKLIFLSVLCFSLSAFSQSHHFQLTVIAPKNTPIDDKLYIAGGHSLLGNWNPSKIALTRTNDSTWIFSASFEGIEAVEFKITRGSFDTEAIYESNKIPGNTVVRFKESNQLILRPVSWKDLSDLHQKPTGQITGAVRYHRDLSWPSLNYKRDVIVWLPPSYEKEPNNRYPVLYMLDGQNIIDPKTSSFGKDWQVDEVMTELIDSGKVEEAIIVGIYNSPDRTPEYSDSPLGKAFAEFVVRSVKPMIDKTYRTKPEAQSTSIMGSSMGGLDAFLFVWWYPEVFTQAGCISSAFIDPFDDILSEVEKSEKPNKNLRFFFDMGDDALDTRLKPGTEKMISILEKKGFVRGKNLEWYFASNASHSEDAWAKRVWRPLLFMYGKK